MRVLAAPLLAALVAVALTPPPAAAASVALGGLVFTDELGGFVLVEGSGSGRLDDPFVLVEEIHDAGPAILTIHGRTSAFGNRIGSQHDVGFALTKIVRNRSPHAWPVFDLELRRFMEYESPLEDGLSFGQDTDAGRPFWSDRYARVQEIIEPFDAVVFSGGLVQPGETVVLSVVVTDAVPKPVFHIIQLRDSPVARAPSTRRARLAAVAERDRRP